MTLRPAGCRCLACGHPFGAFRVLGRGRDENNRRADPVEDPCGGGANEVEVAGDEVPDRVRLARVELLYDDGVSPRWVNVAVAWSDWMTYVAVLPTTCPGVKSPLPLNAASTVCPLSHVNGIVVVLGSAEAAGAKAIAATAPEMTVAHMRLSMRMFLSLQDVSGRPAQGTHDGIGPIWGQG